uniref:RING-type E3 ubiquitin transferase n=2 Tax=Nicotiana TaxID=4085 RepID=A0A1S3XI99_TOBAC|nr:PREDICTED: putative RING-H2 finger protein ATL50 [Nicotiana sylvestris]XP_016439638.1 PREDICTED: putative RING-H2 finger protein ATL50 [Nicotiana tabacum]
MSNLTHPSSPYYHSNYGRPRQVNDHSSRRHHRPVHHNPRTNYPPSRPVSRNVEQFSIPRADDESMTRQNLHQNPAFPHRNGINVTNLRERSLVDMVSQPAAIDNLHGHSQDRSYPPNNYSSQSASDPSWFIRTFASPVNSFRSDHLSTGFDFDCLYDLLDLDHHLSTGSEFDSVYDLIDPKESVILKYLKTRLHRAPVPKDEVNPTKTEVVSDEEPEICAICQAEYEEEETMGTLQCGHEYHMDCIKQWILRKQDCPMCRASIFPSQH